MDNQKENPSITRLDCNNCKLGERLVNATDEEVLLLLAMAEQHKKDQPTHGVHFMQSSQPLEPRG
jgi:hypothetical protein